MSAYMILHLSIKDQAAYEEFIEKLIPIYSEFKAKVLVADDKPRLIEGDYPHKHVVVVEFEDRETLNAFYISSKIKELKKLRNRAADITIIFAEGVYRL